MFASVLQVILCALLSSAAALPTLKFPVVPSILQTASAIPKSTGLIPLGTALPFHYQNVVLVFTEFGRAIPQTEIVDTLAGAVQIAAHFVDIEPQQTIPENLFSFHLLYGNVNLAIGGREGKEMTWHQLYHVIQALTRFMLLAPLGPHDQEVNFDIQSSDERETLGFGVILYLQMDSEEVQNGTTTTPTLAVSNGSLLQERTVTNPVLTVSNSSLLALNRSGNLTLALSSDDEVLYPVPGTSLTLEFYFLSLGLPPDLVEVNLADALDKAREYSPGPFENYTIKNNHFYLITRGATSTVASTVYPLNNHQLTWLELSYVLRGLRQFVFGANQEETHFQTLGYRVLDNDKGKIGVGTLSYYDPRTPAIERRAMPDRESSLGSALTQIAKPTNQSFPSVIEDIIPDRIPYPIPESELTLTFTVMGHDIPLADLLALLAATQLTIAANVTSTPDGPINSFRYENVPGTLIISVLTYKNKIVTWLELHQVLAGLGPFCAEEGHSRAWAFQISGHGQGTIGFGIITHHPDPTLIQRRASDRRYISRSDSKSLSRGNTTAMKGFPVYPIPGTPITLDLAYIGSAAILPIDLSATLTSALKVIEPLLKRDGAQAIPENQWAYVDTITNVCFAIVAHTGRTLSWQQLNWILIGLLHWMTGPGLSDCKNLAFDIEVTGQEGMVGMGSVFQSPPPIAVMKDRDPASLFNTSPLDIGTVGNRDSVSGNSLERRAAESPSPAEEGILPKSVLTSPWLSQVATHSISWSGFGETLRGLLSFVTRKTTQTLFKQSLLSKRDIDMAERSTAQGQHGHTAYLPETLAARSVSSSNGTNLTELDPFPIPHTDIVLRIELNSQAIPASRLADLFIKVRLALETTAQRFPHAYYNKDMFRRQVKYPSFEIVEIEVHMLKDKHLTWLELYQSINGLQNILNGAFRQSVIFWIEINQVILAFGLLSYYPPQPTSTLESRSLPPPNANLTIVPYPIPNTVITLQITLFSQAIPASRLTDVFINARLALELHVRFDPDEYFDKDVFSTEVEYPNGNLIAVNVYPQGNEHLTWLQLYQSVNGLQLFVDGAGGRPHREALVFKVEINGVFVAYGMLIYVSSSPTSTLESRSLPPPNANLTDIIPYPLIGTPITLAFTALLPTPIPIDRVLDFFGLAFDEVGEEIKDHRPGASTRVNWIFRYTFLPRGEMSIAVHRIVGKTLTWNYLAVVLEGVLDFMEGKWRPKESLQALIFNIEIVEQGVVGRGTLSYAAGSLDLGDVAGNSSISKSTSLS